VSQITFVVFTYNEEGRIERVIRNFLGAGHILIVDNYSTDRTVELARRHGCEILLNRNQGWVEDAITAARVKEAVKTPWIYWAYADEIIGRTTLTKIMETIENPQLSVVNVYRKNYFYGVFCHDAFADKTSRVFRKEAIDFADNTIHHFGKISVAATNVHTLDKSYYVHHFITYTAKSYIAALDRYTDIEAEQPGRPLSLARTAASVSKTFVMNFFVRRAYRAAMAGLILTLFQCIYLILAFMKKYERRFQLNSQGIESVNNRIRDELLADFAELNSVQGRVG
jgi:glycosyltransferase involved in cell wall biosynthesis